MRKTAMAERATSIQAVKAEGYEVTRFNALRHGVLSRYTVLPWEDADEYQALVAALVAQHSPQGPTEEHLVEELVGILWRKRRLRLAEAAAFRRGLTKVASPDQQTIQAALVHLDVEKHTADDTANALSALNEDQAILTRALDLLQAGKARAYDKALSALHEEMQERWAELSTPKPQFGLLDLGNVEARYTADAEGLLKFLQEQVIRYGIRRQELQNRALIRDQAFGEALDPDHLEGLARYEVHLDRKMERMLAMLIRLQEFRAAPGQE
jgi:hypothetical protein